jgi:hypothetical protein
LSYKLNLNQRFGGLLVSTIDVKTIVVPFIIMTSLEAVIYTLYMASSVLHVVDEIITISVPANVLAIKNHGIEATVLGLKQ